MVLGKLPVPGRPTIWVTVGQGPTALAIGAGGFFLDIFILVYPFSPLSPSLWETARYRLKYCLKGPLDSKQPNNQLELFGGIFPSCHSRSKHTNTNLPHLQTTHRDTFYSPSISVPQ